ncbi:MAG: SMP-30/gluconolactonase/LRE family protein, partial [Verrucomicrobiia bacterium]
MNRFLFHTSVLSATAAAAICLTSCSTGRKKTAASAPEASAGAQAAAITNAVQTNAAKVYPSIGTIERLDPALDAIIPPDARIEKLVGGLEWSEGPVWDRKTRTLLFSDIPRNVVFQWKEGVGTRDFLLPSGYTGSEPRGGESGSNGLTFDKEHRLVLCQHGDRRVARFEPERGFVTLAEYYLFRRFNSPNDLVYKSNGDLYFTDPPYGLEKLNDDPRKELVFNGVYLLRASGEVVLLTSELSFPNGIAFSPDEKTVYIAVSDPARPVIMAYD